MPEWKQLVQYAAAADDDEDNDDDDDDNVIFFSNKLLKIGYLINISVLERSIQDCVHVSAGPILQWYIYIYIYSNCNYFMN